MYERIQMKVGIQIIADWLKEKALKVNENNPKANQGLVALKFGNIEKNSISYILTALTLMTQRFNSDKGDSPMGHAKLTELSISIGKAVITVCTQGELELSPYKLLPIGDAILGGFVSNGYIEVYRDEDDGETEDNEFATRPYLVKPTMKFDELAELNEEIDKVLLTASSKYEIKTINNMIQKNGRSVIKMYTEDHDEDLNKSIQNKEIWLQSLNKMQQRGWKINKEVLTVVNKQFPDMLLDEVPIPGNITRLEVDKAFLMMRKKDTPYRRKKYSDAVELWNKELPGLIARSKNLETKMIHRKANMLSQWISFYQYGELDYRGRVYYQEPFMNYQGTDMARGLMLFSEGKPLDTSGVRWLAIHTACSYNQSYSIDEIPSWCTYDYKSMLEDQGLEDISVDKMTLKDREEWTWQNLEMITGHRNEIVDCEKPVVYLACCIEWCKYILHRDQHISYLPIPIDGSCNGYQHSGAIAKDEITGSLVSLTDQEVQADLYLRIAKAIKEKRKDFFKKRPKMKMKHIRKGIAKRGVMTRAYSASSETIAENMYADCHQLGYTKEFKITMLDCIDLANDLYELISTECPGATKTMKYLQNLAGFQLGSFKTYVNGKEISRTEKLKRHKALQDAKKTKDNVKVDAAAKKVKEMHTKCVRGNGTRWLEWTTPTGFKVRYHVYHTSTLRVRSYIPGWHGGSKHNPGRISHRVVVQGDVPDSSKFAAGISPNFIHSMDAAHMSTVIQQWDGPFGAVHDSYSALACDVEKLSKLTRKVFVDIYDQEDTYQWIADMILKGDTELDFDIPEVGKLDVKEVLNSRYFFS